MTSSGVRWRRGLSDAPDGVWRGDGSRRAGLRCGARHPPPPADLGHGRAAHGWLGNHGPVDRHPHQREPRRLRHHRPLLRLRPRHRGHGTAIGVRLDRLLPLRPLAARLGDRPRLHLGQPRRRRDHGHVGQRRPVRHLDRALLLDRRHPRHALPRRRDDAVLLRLEGALGPRVHVPPLRHRRPPRQRDQLRRRPAAHRRRQPLPARLDRARAARLAAVGGAASSRPRSCCPTSPSAVSRRRSTTRCCSSSSSSPRCCR